MSLTEALKNQKSKLKKTETVVTQIDGRRFVLGDEGRQIDRTHGFVVDTKPDNIPCLVIDHLYIGSQDCIDLNILAKYNIKNVLSLGINIGPIPNITSKFVECLDLPETDIMPVLNISLPFIEDSLLTKSNIIVHCNAGVSRSSMVVIAYLIFNRNKAFQEAYDLVKLKRPAIQPNVGFVKQLKLL